MNKTVNINLAGIFFHIDEEAYLKLKRYLETIKRSFTNSQGSDEIISDIEARIAELFSEKIKDERQVISLEQVDQVISVMGQPEDYQVDEEIFEDEPQARQTNNNHTSSTPKQLFRDTEKSYVAGVTAGLGHYLRIDPVWLRIAWVLLTIFSSGAFILIYIAFWIFVPEAKTTADQLAMRGKPINVSNIEKKIKEGFDGISDTVKNVDYEKYGKKVKSSSATFFDAIGDIILFVLKVFVKFIGGVLIFIAGTTLISLFISLFTVGSFDLIDNAPWIEYIEVSNLHNTPIWLTMVLVLFAIGIPFFFLFILGLKILIKNLKSIGTPAKLTLLAVWILSIIGLSVIGIHQITQQAFKEKVVTIEQELAVSKNDTLQLKMANPNHYISDVHHRGGFRIKSNTEGKKVIVFRDIELFIKPSKIDTIAKITIEKTAEGNSSDDARSRAEAIDYSYKLENNTLILDAYALTDYANQYRDQEVAIILSIPEGMTIFANDNTYSYNNSWGYDNFLPISGKEEHFLTLQKGKFTCTDCIDNETDNQWKYDDDETDHMDTLDVDINTEDGAAIKVKVDEEEIIDINIQ